MLEPLAWDSEFFGVKIARLELNGLDRRALAEVEEQARSQGVECIYGYLDPDQPEAGHEVQASGYRLVDAAVMLSRPADFPVSPPPSDVQVRRGTGDDVDSLAEAITRVSPWSRFAADPRFGVEAARRMHEAGVRRAALGDGHERVLVVAEDGSEPIGFMTCTRTPQPRLDVIGATKLGKGVAWALMSYAIAWAGEETLLGGPIAARNVPTLRFAEHCGLRVTWVRYVFHRWLDEW